MELIHLLDSFGYVIYAALALDAIWGAYNVVMIYRGIGKRSLADPEAGRLLEAVREAIGRTGQAKAAVELCRRPPYWHTSLGQLYVVGLTNMVKGLAKVRRLLVTEFHTRVVSSLENRLASVMTASKMGPLLGLLGTVVGMIGAFSSVGSGGRASDSGSQLAASIALGLWATAVGLLIATSLMLIANDLNNRLRRLRDQTERQLQDFLELLEAEAGRLADPRASAPARPAAASPRASSTR